MKTIIYEKPTCTTCRKAVKMLQEFDTDFTRINYFEENFDAETLESLLKKAGLKPSDILRKKEAKYKELGIAAGGFTEEQILGLLIANPELIQRPLIIRGGKVVLARPVEKLKELF